MKFKKTLLTLAASVACSAALADINIGVSLALTGPGSGLGIPMQNQLKLFPRTIGGEKVNLIVLDDATDPGKGSANARRFVSEDKVDVIYGSCITAVAAAIEPNLNAHDSRIAQRRENGVLEVFGFKGGLRASLGLAELEIGQC